MALRSDVVEALDAERPSTAHDVVAIVGGPVKTVRAHLWNAVQRGEAKKVGRGLWVRADAPAPSAQGDAVKWVASMVASSTACTSCGTPLEVLSAVLPTPAVLVANLGCTSCDRTFAARLTLEATGSRA